MTASPLTRNNFKVVSVLIKFSDPENPNNKISTLIDKSSVLQFEYREGLLNQFISVTLQIVDTTSQLTDVLVGMEEIELVVEDETTNVKYEFTSGSSNGPLYVYQIHDKQVIDTGKILVLELCRKDALELSLIHISEPTRPS